MRLFVLLSIALALLLESVCTLAFAASYQSAFVSAPGKFPANHGASIAELANGDLLACWYAGSRELAPDVQIYCSRRPGGSPDWREPAVAVRAGETTRDGWLANGTLGNTVLHAGADGKVWLFYNATTLARGWSASHVAYKVSTDSGKTWSDRGTRLTSYWGNLVKNKPLGLPDGRLLLPLYHEFFGVYGYSCVLTPKDDRWNDSRCSTIPGRSHLQPALLHLPDKRVGAYLRNGEKGPVLLSILSQSYDGWSAPAAINLPNPNAAVDVTTTPSSGLLMIYNNSATERSVLSAAVSRDGRQFTWKKDLENDPRSRGFSYPAVMRDRRGLFHVVYTYRHRSAIKHAAFDEAWLDGG